MKNFIREVIVKSFVFVVTVLFSIDLYAGEWHKSEIQRIYPLSDGAFVLTFKADHTDCKNGGSPKYFYVKVGEGNVTQEAQNKMFSVALAGAIGGKEISVNFETVTNYCYINRLHLEF